MRSTCRRSPTRTAAARATFRWSSSACYLEALGVDVLWLTPIHPSPFADHGYDVADYLAVDPRFGTLEDVERLVEAAGRHGIRILLDIVPNHTSDRHPWFRDAVRG